MKLTLIKAITLFGAVGLVSAAQASVVTATFTGTVLNNGVQTDSLGLFGPANQDLSGQSFTASYTYDTSLGKLTVGAAGSSLCTAIANFGPCQRLGGGPNSGPLSSTAASPITAESITINGKTVTVDAKPSGSIYTENDGPTANPLYSEFHIFGGSPNGNYLFFDVYPASDAIPNSLTTPFVYAVPPSPPNYGATLYEQNTDGTVFTQLSLVPAELVVSVTTAPTPTPGAGLAGLFALLLAGWGVRSRAARG